MTDQKKPNQGQQKEHELSKATGEKMTVTQQRWREEGKALKAEGWTRVEEADDDTTEDPA